MTNTTILNELNLLKETNFNLLVFEKLLDKIKLEINAEENKTTTSKQRIKTIDTQMIKKQTKKTLTYYTNKITGFKTFTNSYFLVALKDIDFNGLTLQCAEENNVIYPNLDKIIDLNYKNYRYNITLKVNDILNDIKTTGFKGFKEGVISYHNVIYNYVDENGTKQKIGFSCGNLKLFLMALNLTPSDTITLYFKNNYSPAYVENKNKSFGLLLPIRLK